MRVIAVDWSGALAGSESKIWLAEVEDGAFARVECGRSRSALVAHLIDLAKDDPYLVAGFDFSFSAPAWFLEELGLASAAALWELATERSEEWLTECKPPFWGRGPTKRPILPRHLRVTDETHNIGGITPKSVFQIGGAGQVGTGSLRGWPHLHTLHEGGFAIWPFDRPSWPLAVEIYPRLLTGRVVKSSPEGRLEYLTANYPVMSADSARIAASSEDAFDAAISALRMSEADISPTGLPKVSDPVTLLEGMIWDPATAL